MNGKPFKLGGFPDWCLVEQCETHDDCIMNGCLKGHGTPPRDGTAPKIVLTAWERSVLWCAVHAFNGFTWSPLYQKLADRGLIYRWKPRAQAPWWDCKVKLTEVGRKVLDAIAGDPA